MKKFALLAAICLGLCVASCGNRPKESFIEQELRFNIPTEELLEKFPITFETPATTAEEKGIQNRMLNGFNCWNEGFDAWKSWGDVLYSPESIYHVNGVRCTLEEYQKAMNITLSATDIQMGDFDNMILSGDWTAIRYQTTHRRLSTGEVDDVPVTEFVHFKDFGVRGMKVDEGWGGIKGGSYNGLMSFQTPEERAAQVRRMEEIMATTLPETSDLEQKYPVLYPTPIESESGKLMKEMLLKEIDSWNRGLENWIEWTDVMYSKNVTYDYNGTSLGFEGMQTNGARLFAGKDIKRVKIYNILVSADWAAIHSWHVVTSGDGSKDVFDNMSFYHFIEEDGSLKVDKCWIKENL